jgi:hypothetical protein
MADLLSRFPARVLEQPANYEAYFVFLSYSHIVFSYSNIRGIDCIKLMQHRQGQREDGQEASAKEREFLAAPPAAGISDPAAAPDSRRAVPEELRGV